MSEYYNLGRRQPSLDFVDVELDHDAQVFLDPRALRLLRSNWGGECVALIQDFFQRVLSAIREGRSADGRALLEALREPNETRLGLSSDRPRGRALGPESALHVWEALTTSEATRSGLLEDLEDTILMIEGISADIVSDIATNIIRDPLIRYTQRVCAQQGIPLEDEVASGPLWDPSDHQWYTRFVQLPVPPGGKLLLVPKGIVRTHMDYDADEYYRLYILEYLRGVELDSNSELVQLLKRGGRRVTKKALREKYGAGKATIVRETLRAPEILDSYRRDKRDSIRPPLDHGLLADIEGTAAPDWDQLLAAVVTVPTGKDHANAYEEAIEALLTALFYPSLSDPRLQHRIHEGRKRIDISYTNMATTGFFRWLAQHHPASYFFVECKNYTADPANPELDQLAGRFSPRRGRCGMLVTRRFDNPVLFLRRCRDTADDDRGFIIPVDDADLQRLVADRSVGGGEDLRFPLLRERLDALVM